MPSYRHTSTTLQALQRRRVDGERQAERALGAALAAHRRAEAGEAELAGRMASARAALEAARLGLGSLPTTGAEVAGQRRYWSRLGAAVAAAAAALEAHRSGALAQAIREVAASRGAHLMARQRREVVDKAIARREAAAQLDGERRDEAELDDRARRPRER